MTQIRLKEEIVPLTIIILGIFLILSPVLINGNIKVVNINDFYLYNSYFTSPKITVSEYAQAPVWSPYFGGGIKMIGHPEDISLSPLFIPILVFGNINGIKIIVFTLFILGSLGLYLLLRDILEIGRFTSTVSTLFFIFSSTFASFLSDAYYISELMMILIPLMIYLYEKSIKDYRYIFLCVPLISTFFFTGAHATLFTMLFFGLYILTRTISKKGIDKNILKISIIILIISGTLVFVKIASTQSLLSENPSCIRSYDEDTSNCLYDDYESIEHRSTKDFFKDFLKKEDWEERNYFGLVPTILFSISFLCLKNRFRKIFPWILSLVLFSLFALGKNSFIDPYYIIWNLPFYHEVINKAKYCMPIILTSFIMILSIGIDSIYNKKDIIIKSLLITLLVLSITDIFLVSNSINSKTREYDAIPKITIEDFHHTKISSPKDTRETTDILKSNYKNIRKGIGTINWGSVLILDEKAKPKYTLVNDTKIPDKDYKGEVYFNSQENIADIKYFSPNRITIDTNIKQDDILTINQNFHPSWKTDQGEIFENDGLIGIKLKKDIAEVTIYFQDYLYMIGISLGVILLIACHIFLLKKVNKDEIP